MSDKLYYSNSLLLITIIWLTLSGCRVYTPDAYNPIITNKQGEINLSGSAMVAQNIVGANASITGSLTDELALQGNISVTSSHLRILNFKAGYLLNPGDKFEIRPILGYQHYVTDYYYYPVNNDIYAVTWYGNMQIPYAGVQISTNKPEETIGFALKVGSVYSDLRKGNDYLNGDDEYFDITEHNILLEPSIFMSHHITKRLSYNASLSLAVMKPTEVGLFPDEVDFRYLKSPVGSFGISYDIISKSKRH